MLCPPASILATRIPPLTLRQARERAALDEVLDDLADEDPVALQPEPAEVQQALEAAAAENASPAAQLIVAAALAECEPTQGQADKRAAEGLRLPILVSAPLAAIAEERASSQTVTGPLATSHAAAPDVNSESSEQHVPLRQKNVRFVKCGCVC